MTSEELRVQGLATHFCSSAVNQEKSCVNQSRAQLVETTECSLSEKEPGNWIKHKKCDLAANTEWGIGKLNWMIMNVE